MKAAIMFLLFVSCALAQESAAPAPAPGCGPLDAKFEVKLDKAQHPLAKATAPQAVVYFVEDDTHFQSVPKPTTRVGIDGAWVGANHGNSYSYFAVDPGEHHLCASWQSFVGFGSRNKSAAAHFTAEPGGVYYFRINNTWLRASQILGIELTPLDSDEGQLLANEFSLSSSRPKD